MNRIRIYRLNEWHPGASDIVDSINYFIEDRAEKLGIPIEDSLEAIRMLIQYREDGVVERVREESTLSRAIRNLETAIETMIDDGWPEDWIYDKLKAKITEATD